MKCPMCDNDVWHPIDLAKVAIDDDMFNSSYAIVNENKSRIYICTKCGVQVGSKDELDVLSALGKTTFELVPKTMAKIQRKYPSLTTKELRELVSSGVFQSSASLCLVTSEWLESNALPMGARLVDNSNA